MDIAFISIHDLTAESNVLFASASVDLTTGFAEAELEGSSGLSLVHADDLDRLRDVLTACIEQDGAGVLVYYRLRHKLGHYVAVESLMSVVYNILVVSTCVHTQTIRSEGRALNSPLVARAFAKGAGGHEPRVALILNRLSLRLPIMYATSEVTRLFGISPDEIKSFSFWDCMADDELENMQLVLERVKENESVTYARFVWQDPRSRLASPCARHSSTVNVEAIVSSTSDGILVVLKHGDEKVPSRASPFASPWALAPVLPPPVPHSLVLEPKHEYSDPESS